MFRKVVTIVGKYFFLDSSDTVHITLVEQTIGRGLRLPYGGKRTGDADVDKLTVIAHENFDEVIKRAQEPGSLLNKLSYIELDEDELHPISGKVVHGKTSIEERFEEDKKNAEKQYQKEVAKAEYDAKMAVWDAIPQLNTSLKNLSELSTVKNKEKLKDLTKQLSVKRTAEQFPLFADEEAAKQLKHVDAVIDFVVEEFKNNVIEIPRVVIDQPHTRACFKDFDLDTTSGFSFPELNNEIIRMGLKDNDVEVLTAKTSGYFNDPVQEIVSQLIDFEEVDYDENADLLFKLAKQAVDAMSSNAKNKEEVASQVHQFKFAIANHVFKQMMEHFVLEKVESGKLNVLPFVGLQPQHLTEETAYGRRDYRVPFEKNKKSLVKKYIFTGFAKSYYLTYKFDSSTELDFAFLLENDNNVLKWIRPVPNQFKIYWGNGAHQYEPDFVVETESTIYMIETKADMDIEDKDVQSKKEAAEKYCQIVSEYTSKNRGKPWRYAIIGESDFEKTHQLKYVLSKYIFK